MDFAEYEEKLDGFIDNVGGKEVWDKASEMLKENAVFSTIVGDDPTLADLTPTTIRAASEDFPNYKFVIYSSTRQKLREIVQWIREKKLKPRTYAVYPADRIRDA